jgi:hypothetical protein
MSYGPIKVYPNSVASGASTVSFVLDKAYSKIYADVGTMSTAAELSVWGAVYSGGSFHQVTDRVKTATMQYQTLVIPTAVAANGGCFEVPVYPSLQFRASAVVSGGVSFSLICVD